MLLTVCGVGYVCVGVTQVGERGNLTSKISEESYFNTAQKIELKTTFKREEARGGGAPLQLASG